MPRRLRQSGAAAVDDPVAKGRGTHHDHRSTLHGPQPRRVLDDDFLVIFNAHHEEDSFTLPGAEWGEHWLAEIDTGAVVVDQGRHEAGSELKVQPRSVIVLRSPRETPPQPSGAATTTRT